MADVFISYSRKDQAFVRRLHKALSRRNREAWVDWDDIRPTEEFMRAISDAIEGADTFVFVLSPDAVASSICAEELAHAVRHNKRMVPIVAREVAAAAVPESLAKLNWIFNRDGDDFEQSVDTLIVALDTDLNWVHRHTRLLGRALEWDASGRDNSFVLRGVDLQDAERWLSEAGADKERQPTVIQTEYIISSRKNAARRQRNLLASVTFGLVVAIGLAIVAFFARQEAVRQAAQARSTSAQADFDLAIQYRESADVVEPRTLAHLARSLRTMPEARLSRMYLASLLRTTSWWLPRTQPLAHDGDVVDARFSPDGRRIVTASTDRTVRVWNADTGEPLTQPISHAVEVTVVAFSPDGSRIATGSGFGGTAQVFDATTGKAIGEPLLPPGEATVAVEFSPDGRRLVTASFAPQLASFAAQVWDAESGKPVGTPLRHDDALTTASFSPDGKRVVTASKDGRARVWDAETGRALIEPVGHTGEVTCAAFAPDGQRIVTGSRDNTARVWDAATGQPVTEPLVHQGAIVAASFSRDGRQVVTGSSDGYARVWDASTGTPEGVPMRHAAAVSDVHFNSDGRAVLTASLDGTARVWDPKTGQPVGQPMRHQRAVLKAAFSADAQRIVTASQDRTARVWNTISRASAPMLLEHNARIRTAAFNTDGTRVVTTVENHTAQLWNVQNGTRVGDSFPGVYWVWPSSFSADGRWVLAVLDDGNARVWEAASGKAVGEPLRDADPLVAANFSPDGQRIATATRTNVISVWDFEHRSLIYQFPHPGDVDTIKFSSDGHLLIVRTRDNTITLWDPQQRTQVAAVPPLERQGFRAGEFSADGAWIVAPLMDFSARVREIRGGKVMGSPMLHDGQIEVAGFSADGGRVVTGGYDTTAQVWDTQTALPLGGRIRHAGVVRTASFNADGSLLVTGGDDGIARIWDAETGRPAGEWLPHRGGVNDVSFSHDGTRILTVSGNVAQVWDVAVDVGAPLPVWVAQLAEALAGGRLDDSGVLVAPDKSVPNLRRELLALPGTDFWSRLGRWFFKEEARTGE